jgi:hypothetical protein
MFMNRMTSIEYCGLALGVFLVLAGSTMVIWPQPAMIPHFTNDALGMFPHSEPEFVTTSGARVYGLLSIVCGAGVVWLAAYRRKNDEP